VSASLEEESGPRRRQQKSSTSGRRRACRGRCGRQAGPEPRGSGAWAAPTPVPAQNSSSSASNSSCVRGLFRSRQALSVDPCSSSRHGAARRLRAHEIMTILNMWGEASHYGVSGGVRASSGAQRTAVQRDSQLRYIQRSTLSGDRSEEG
jgi:hypothetical protein